MLTHRELYHCSISKMRQAVLTFPFFITFCTPLVHHIYWYETVLAARSFPGALTSPLNKLSFGGSAVNLIQCDVSRKAVINVVQGCRY